MGHNIDKVNLIKIKSEVLDPRKYSLFFQRYKSNIVMLDTNITTLG